MPVREYNHRLRFGRGTEDRDYYVYDELGSGPRVVYTTSSPGGGAGTWRTGDIALDISSGATRVGWKCTAGGTPGTWVEIGGSTSSSTIFTSAPSGTVRGWGEWLPDTGTVINDVGMNFVNRAGVYATPTPASTNLRTSRRRWTHTTAGAAGSSAIADTGLTGTDGSFFWRGNGTNLGGFLIMLLGMSFTMNSDSRCFYGYWADGATSPGATTDPSTFVDIFGIACDTGDANLQIMHNDGAGSATKIDLGASFDKDAAGFSDQVWDIYLFCASNSSTMYYRLVRRDSAVSDVAGSITTNLPTNTVFGKFLMHMNNSPGGGTAVAAGINIRQVYAEWGTGQGVTDYGLVI